MNRKTIKWQKRKKQEGNEKKKWRRKIEGKWRVERERKQEKVKMAVNESMGRSRKVNKKW